MKMTSLLLSAVLSISILAAPMADAASVPVSDQVVVLDGSVETSSEVRVPDEAAYTDEPRIATLTETGNQTSVFTIALLGVVAAVALYLGNYLRRFARQA